MDRKRAALPSVTTYELHSVNTHVPARWFWLARISLLTLFILNLILYIIGTPVYFAQLSLSYHDCFQDCLSPATFHSLHALGLSTTAYAAYWTTINLLFVLAYFVVATLIIWRKPNDWMALLAAFFLVALGGSFPDVPAALAAVHPAWKFPVTLVSEDVVGFPSLLIFFFLFPNGRFVPRWSRWIVIGSAALFLPSAFFPDTLLNASNWPTLLFFPIPLAVFGTLIYAQVYRYRHVSTTMERQQTKWIVYGTAIALLGFLLLGVVLARLLRVLVPLQSLSLLPNTILITSIYLLLLLIPLSLALAILRYRLWDVDVLINMTLVYGLLTSALVGVYAGCIIISQALLRGVFNQTSDVAVVVSTLVIAALFQPLRKLIQGGIDRRFYRHKYNAARTLAAFNTTLRSEVDLSRIRENLVAVVQETMQPTHISLWLNQSSQRNKPNTDA